jgi:chromatin structure-remodeling complex subunit RSC9
MAPPPPDLPDNEEAFLDELADYHERRGYVPSSKLPQLNKVLLTAHSTNFDRDPKVAGRPINLLKLYRLVLENGGYDALSAERMRWRSLVKQFGFGNHHEAAMTFQLKTVYYKNLA